ncbi:MAG: glycosyltransferase family 4 protein [Candidatus Hodarchaeota archaeon]
MIKKYNILDFSIGSTYPPKSGDQLRIYNLNLNTSSKYNIVQFSFFPSEYIGRKYKLLSNLKREVKKINKSFPIKTKKIPYTNNYLEYTWINPSYWLYNYIKYNLSLNLPIFLPEIIDPNTVRFIKHIINKSNIIQLENPFLYDIIKNYVPRNKIIILVEHNVFSELYKNKCNKTILKIIKEKEKQALEMSDIIIVVSDEDKNILCDAYDVDKNSTFVIPNGVNASKIEIPTIKEKNVLKKKFGLSNKFIILFTGSNYFPNIEAVKYINNIIRNIKNENTLFLIAGSVGDHVKRIKNKNIIYTGFVDNIEPFFKMADIAINPVITGGGTNIKILEYMAYGLPVITTKFGARGLCITNNKNIIISKRTNFSCKIEELIYDEKKRQILTQEGKKLVNSYYDWKVLADKMLNIYNKIL